MTGGRKPFRSAAGTSRRGQIAVKTLCKDGRDFQIRALRAKGREYKIRTYMCEQMLGVVGKRARAGALNSFLIFEALNSLFDFGRSARAGALNSFLILEALNSFFDFGQSARAEALNSFLIFEALNSLFDFGRSARAGALNSFLIFEALNSLFDFGQSARAGALNSFLIFEALNSFFDFLGERARCRSRVYAGAVVMRAGSSSSGRCGRSLRIRSRIAATDFPGKVSTRAGKGVSRISSSLAGVHFNRS
jgi:hypothetical protein